MTDRKHKYSDSEESDIYEVEFVYGKKMSKKKAHYAVKWLGWPLSQMSWEPLTSFTQQSSYLVKRFETRLCYQIYYKKIMPSQGGIRIHIKGRFCQSYTAKRKLGEQKELKDTKEVKDNKEHKELKDQKELKELKEIKEPKESKEIKKIQIPETADPFLKAQFIINQVKKDLQQMDIPFDSLTKQEKKKKKTISKSIKTIDSIKPKEVISCDILPQVIKDSQIKEIKEICPSSSIKKPKQQDWDLERDIKLLILSEQKEQKKKQLPIETKVVENQVKTEQIIQPKQIQKPLEEAKQQPQKVSSKQIDRKLEEVDKNEQIIQSQKLDDKVKQIKEVIKKRKDCQSDEEVVMKKKIKQPKLKESKKKEQIVSKKKVKEQNQPQSVVKVKKNKENDEYLVTQEIDFELDLFDDFNNQNFQEKNSINLSSNKNEEKVSQLIDYITPKRLFNSSMKSNHPRVVKSVNRIQVQSNSSEQDQSYKTEKDYLNEIIMIQKKKELESYRSGTLKQVLFKEPKVQTVVRTSQQIQQEIQKLQLEKIALNKPSRCSVPIIPKYKDSEVQTDEIQIITPQIKVFDNFGNEIQNQKIQIESIHTHKLFKGKLLFKCINEDGKEYLLEYQQLAQNCPTTLIDYMIVNSILI